jgi:hypothetical protein
MRTHRHALLKCGNSQVDSSDLPIPPVLSPADATAPVPPDVNPDDAHVGHHKVPKVHNANIDKHEGHVGIPKVRHVAVERYTAQHGASNVDSIISDHGGQNTAPEVYLCEVQTHENTIGTSKVRPAYENGLKTTGQDESVTQFGDLSSVGLSPVNHEHKGRPPYESKVRPMSDASNAPMGYSEYNRGGVHGKHAWSGNIQSSSNAPSKPLASSGEIHPTSRLVSNSHVPFESQDEVANFRAASY